MLKTPHRFLSVNSHNNIAPTITQLLAANYPSFRAPKEVHWLGSVLDTASNFRNIHAMPFMSWSREIKDYIYKEYFLSGNELYRLTHQLLEVPYTNDTLKNKMTGLRDNFKLINSYVCQNNKVYPKGRDLLPGEKILLKEYNEPALKLIYSKSPDTSLTADFIIPHNCKYLYVEATAHVNMKVPPGENQPAIRFALIDTKNGNRDYVYWSMRDIITLSKGDFISQKWNEISVHDLFPLDDYKHIKDLVFETAIFTETLPINLQLQHLNVKIYGIK